MSEQRTTYLISVRPVYYCYNSAGEELPDSPVYGDRLLAVETTDDEILDRLVNLAVLKVKGENE